jgi:hypothetical protein
MYNLKHPWSQVFQRAENKKPAEAGSFNAIPASCRQPSKPWPIILDPEAFLCFS